MTETRHMMLAAVIITVAMVITAKPYSLKEGHCYQYIKDECKKTSYPVLCYRTLWSHSLHVNRSRQRLAATGVWVAFWDASATLKKVSGLKKKAGRMEKMEAAALAQCIELVIDSVSELRDSVAAMRRPRWHREAIDDVETWVSAAITNEGTCVDGFDESQVVGDIRDAVSRRLRRLSRLSSIALYFFTAAYPPNTPPGSS